jgi:NADPH:quinone reductase-like Zn-dependent oxidoreductase
MFGLMVGLASNLFSKQTFVPLAAKPNPQDLLILGGMVAAGQVMPVIDRRYSLSELPEAMRYLGQGHSRGKNVITFEP